MKTRIACSLLATLSVVACNLPLLADFGGSIWTLCAISPDGKALVRISKVETSDDENQLPTYQGLVFSFDDKKEDFVLVRKFPFDSVPPNLLFLSDAGDVVSIRLQEKGALTWYSPQGKLEKAWDLKDFLTESQINGCAETGSTLQWFDEGQFYERTFHFNGPSHRIRAMLPPFTVMRGYDEKVTYAGRLDAEKSELKAAATKLP